MPLNAPESPEPVLGDSRDGGETQVLSVLASMVMAVSGHGYVRSAGVDCDVGAASRAKGAGVPSAGASKVVGSLATSGGEGGT